MRKGKKMWGGVLLSGILALNLSMSVFAEELEENSPNMLLETVVEQAGEDIPLDDIQQDLTEELNQQEEVWLEESAEENAEVVQMPTEEVDAVSAIAEGTDVVIDGTVEVLAADMVVSSLTINGGGTLDLAGHTLTVTGDVTQSKGTISVNKGKLIVNGNYFQGHSANKITMSYAEDYVEIGGNFTADSTASVNSYMKNGVLKIGGDLVVMASNGMSFYPTENHQVVFTGKDTRHEIILPDNVNDCIANLQVESGKLTVGGYLSVENIQSDLDIEVPAGQDMKIRFLGFNGHNVTVHGNVIQYTRAVDLAAGSLYVDGNYTQSGSYSGVELGALNLNRGTMTVTGNFEQTAAKQGILKMRYPEDRLTIGGSFITNSDRDNTLTAGVLTIGKDLIVGGGDELNFYSKEAHEVVFSGNAEHIIDIPDKIDAGIANLKVESGKVTVPNWLSVVKLESDLDIYVPEGSALQLRELGMAGHKVTIHGDVVKYTKILNLAGGNLTVDGNFTQKGNKGANPARVDINRGTMTVTGNYVQESYYGELAMKYPEDKLIVKGDFITNSMKENKYTAGTMTIAGNLTIGAGEELNFYSTNKHEVVFSGADTHQINWGYDKDAAVDNTKKYITNLKVESGKLVTDNFLNVGKLESDLYIKVPDGKTLYLMDFGMNGHIVVIDGNVVKLGGTLDVAGGDLTINGNLNQKAGDVFIDKGKMTVNGDYILEEDGTGKLTMKYTSDILIVTGDFVIRSGEKSTLTDGTMEVKGDFTEEGGNASHFAPSGSHRVNLTGEGVQHVYFENYPNSYFNILYVPKPISTGYVFTPSVCWNTIIGNVNEYTGFNDIQETDGYWKYEYVKYVFTHGIMTGISGTDRFEPDANLNRAMFATVLYRMAGQPSVEFSNDFTDVIDGKYYSKPIIWAYNNGIVKGFEDGSYGIENNITREQIAKMLCEYGKVQGYDVSASASIEEFTDRAEVNGWATEYMQWAVATGMISGKPNGNDTFKLDPKGFATRAECAKMISKFMQEYVD